MNRSVFRTILHMLTLISVMVACGGSFAIGYRVGYHEGWIDAWTRAGSPANVPQVPSIWLTKNKPGR